MFTASVQQLMSLLEKSSAHEDNKSNRPTEQRRVEATMGKRALVVKKSLVSGSRLGCRTISERYWEVQKGTVPDWKLPVTLRRNQGK